MELEDWMVRNKAVSGHPRFHEILNEMRDLHEMKNHDYADGGQEGPIGNFTRVSQIKKMYPKFNWSSPFGVAMSYYLKQFDAVMHMYEQQKTSAVGEDIPKRLMDMATYAPLMIILLEETEHLENTKAPAGDQKGNVNSGPPLYID